MKQENNNIDKIRIHNSCIVDIKRFGTMMFIALILTFLSWNNKISI